MSYSLMLLWLTVIQAEQLVITLVTIADSTVQVDIESADKRGNAFQFLFAPSSDKPIQADVYYRFSPEDLLELIIESTLL